jgi:hypothetical protein
MRVFHGMVVLAVAALAGAAGAKDEPAESSVTCKDASTSRSGKGACSGHGGVDKDATEASKKASGAAAPTAAPSSAAGAAEETVVCKDGATSKSGKGACSGHGGVDKSAAKAGAKSAPAEAGATAATPPAATPPAAAPPRRPAPAATPAPSAAAQGTGSASATAPANAKNTDPTGAIARCKDSTYSHAKGHSGACSKHGGVAEWLDKPSAQ